MCVLCVCVFLGVFRSRFRGRDFQDLFKGLGVLRLKVLNRVDYRVACWDDTVQRAFDGVACFCSLVLGLQGVWGTEL